MIDRLSLSPARVESMAEGMRAVAALPDPVGELLSETARPNGLVIRKVRVPMGVIAIIYEPPQCDGGRRRALPEERQRMRPARRQGGHPLQYSRCRRAARWLEHCGAPGTLVNLVEDTSRASAAHLMEARGFVDLLIPRGGKGLIRACVDSAKVPCIETGTGICHIYVDAAADLQKSPGHRIQRENEPSVRVQRRRGLPGSPGRCRSVPARVGRASGR